MHTSCVNALNATADELRQAQASLVAVTRQWTDTLAEAKAEDERHRLHHVRLAISCGLAAVVAMAWPALQYGR